MSTTRQFAQELTKLAFLQKAPPVLTSALGKTTKGAVSKPATKLKLPTIKTPTTKPPKAVGSAGGSLGTKIDPARKNTPPPPVYGGDNVQ